MKIIKTLFLTLLIVSCTKKSNQGIESLNPETQIESASIIIENTD